MFKLMTMAAVAALAVQFTAAQAAAPAAPGAAASPAIILAAGKKAGVIPANCTMDPFKKVYVCCDGPDNCKEYPLDHKFPVVRQFYLQQAKPLQSQPLMAVPSTTQ